MNVADMVNDVEAAGAAFRLDGDKVRVWYPDEERRQELAGEVAILRDHRADVAAFLRFRTTIPAMPPGVRLVEWKLKEPPVAIETCAVVTNSALFAKSTLEQLRIALTQPERWVGWSVPQLLDRLTQVGVIVTLDTQSKGLDMEEA